MLGNCLSAKLITFYSCGLCSNKLISIVVNAKSSPKFHIIFIELSGPKPVKKETSAKSTGIYYCKKKNDSNNRLILIVISVEKNKLFTVSQAIKIFT